MLIIGANSHGASFCTDVINGHKVIKELPESLLSYFEAYPSSKVFVNNHPNKEAFLSQVREDKVIPVQSYFRSNLSDIELTAISSYKYGNHVVMNNRLRRGDERYGLCHFVESGLNELPSYQSIVFRAIRLDDPVVRANLLQEGSVFIEKGYLSTTRVHEGASRLRHQGVDGIFMVINSKSGKSIENITDEKRKKGSFLKEAEVLFNRDTEFKVEMVQRLDDDSFVVFMNEI